MGTLQKRQQQRLHSLTERAQRDSFLGASDERPTLERILAQLGETLARHEQDIDTPLKETMQALASDIAALQNALSQARERLQNTLRPLLDSADSIRDRRRALADDLEEIDDDLSRRLRLRFLHVLDRAAPESCRLDKRFEVLTAAHAQTAEALPEALRLILTRDGDAKHIEGQRILDAGCRSQLGEIAAHRFFTRLRLRRLRRQLKARYRHLVIPLQDMAYDALVIRTELVPAKLLRRQQNTYTELQKHLADSWRAVRYNLETLVVSLCDREPAVGQEDGTPPGDSLRELATAALQAFDNAREALEETEVTFASICAGIVAEVREDHQNALRAIRQGVDEAGSLRGRLRWTVRSAVKKFQRLLRAGLVVLSNQSERTGRFGKRLRHHIETLRNGFRRALGQPVQEEDTRLTLTDLPTAAEVAEQARSLPAIYRHLFSTKPLINEEFLIGHDKQLQQLRQTLARWQSGRAVSVAVIGQDGSGKTSLLNGYENELEEKHIPVRRFRLRERTRGIEQLIRVLEQAFELPGQRATTDELVRDLLDLPRQVVIVEELHLLLLRTIGMHRVPEAFLSLVMATRHRLLWVVSARLQPWNRMTYLVLAQQYFTHQVYTGFLDADNLREVLLIRLRATGDTPLFTDSGLRHRNIRKLRLTESLESAPVQKALQDEYFSTLYAITGGSVTAALFYWLHSLTRDAGGRIVIRPCARLDDSFIRNLDRYYHFTLAEVLCHGCLSPAEHAEIFRLDPARSRLALDYLSEISLLEGFGRDDRGQPLLYRVNPVFYHAVSRTLEGKHILY